MSMSMIFMLSNESNYFFFLSFFLSFFSIIYRSGLEVFL